LLIKSGSLFFRFSLFVSFLVGFVLLLFSLPSALASLGSALCFFFFFFLASRLAFALACLRLSLLSVSSLFFSLLLLLLFFPSALCFRALFSLRVAPRSLLRSRSFPLFSS
jgi:hypothetical protein